MGKRVGIIGAGVAGLTAIKHCLEEGLEPVCWEQGQDIGGVWNFTPEVKEGFPSLYNSCVINTCKEMTCYSDFPIPKEFPNFMSHRNFKKYHEMYCENFNLRPHVSFGQQVQKVEKAEDFSTSGRWDVTTLNLSTGTIDRHIVDAMMVCNGHLYEPNMPSIKGLDSFKGRVLHTRDYKDFRGFENKRVLVVGMGNSGADVACELSRHSEHVYMSTRSGSYIVQRAGAYGQPYDQRCISRCLKLLPERLMRPIKYNRINHKYKHADYSLSPNCRFEDSGRTISDDLPNRILLGTISMHADVVSFAERSALLEDGTTLENLDAIILATGFRFSFPFMVDDSVIRIDSHHPRLYNLIFPVDLEPCTLAVIGLLQPFGALPPLLEMQSRVVTRVFSGKCRLPDKAEMEKVVNKRQAYLKSKFGDSPKIGLKVLFIDYLDTLGRMIGCKPNLWKLMLTDPMLWYQIYFGPATPPQWRLEGPGRWEGAKEAVAAVQYKTLYPMKTRVAGNEEKNGLYDGWFQILKFILLLLFIPVLYALYLQIN